MNVLLFLYLKLYFDNDVPRSYVEGIDGFGKGTKGGVLMGGFIKNVGGGEGEVDALGEKPADGGIEKCDVGSLGGGETGVVMFCAKSDLPLVGGQERDGEILAKGVVVAGYGIDLVLVVGVGQAIVGGQPTAELALELGRNVEVGGRIRLFHALAHHRGTGMGKEGIKADGDFG